MLGLRIFNGLNGLLYFVYGLIGVFMPSVVFEANALQAVAVHGSHSIRALWGAIFILGALEGAEAGDGANDRVDDYLGLARPRYGAPLRHRS